MREISTKKCSLEYVGYFKLEWPISKCAYHQNNLCLKVGKAGSCNKYMVYMEKDCFLSFRTFNSVRAKMEQLNDLK